MREATHQKHQTQQELTVVGPRDGLMKEEAESLFWGVWGYLNMDWFSGNITELLLIAILLGLIMVMVMIIMVIMVMVISLIM